MPVNYDFTIESLGPCRIASPIKMAKTKDKNSFLAEYVGDDEVMLYDIMTTLDKLEKQYTPKQVLERAGPREKIYFDPAKVHAGIVTCGGLCPGLNDVIRAVVMCLWYHYGVRRISGIRYGYRGLLPDYHFSVMELNPDRVAEIHRQGGTLLGSSRGGGDQVPAMVDEIERMNLNMLFVIGGDGSQKGARAIAEEAQSRGFKLAVVGVPKTIDNDLSFIERSFGFNTAVAEAVRVVSGAHVEAHDAINGVAIVKLMGRQSGYIAAHTALSINDVNFVLIPEVPFDLEGPNGLFVHLKERLESRHHAVIVTAEGAGQSFFKDDTGIDASGNKKLGDIGVFLRDQIGRFFKGLGMEINLRYIDPSYTIRSAPADPVDSLYCVRLGTHAVHAAMAGKTKVLISLVSDHFVHVPITMAVSERNFVDPEGSLWRDVVNATGQPALMTNRG
jgi:6-phosphofructokinase 1